MKKITLIILIIAIIVGLCACTTTQERYDKKIDEWISPDGVHYWATDPEYKYSFLAPRYDNDGNLVIDKSASITKESTCSKCGWAVDYGNFCSKCGAKFTEE